MTTTARFIVLWGQPDDPVAFDRHYRDAHIPLALEIPGLRRYTLSRNVAALRGHDPYYLIAELDFDDRLSLKAAFQSPEGQATAGDVVTLAQHATVTSMIYELEDITGYSLERPTAPRTTRRT